MDPFQGYDSSLRDRDLRRPRGPFSSLDPFRDGVVPDG
jgi:hypothetical protein